MHLNYLSVLFLQSFRIPVQASQAYLQLLIYSLINFLCPSVPSQGQEGSCLSQHALDGKQDQIGEKTSYTQHKKSAVLCIRTHS